MKPNQPTGTPTPTFSEIVVSKHTVSKASRVASSKEAISQTTQSFNFGEIHAVQERFHNLLKQRFLSEYENNPPLFPWESEVVEYPAEVTDFSDATATSSLWDTHVGELQVPGLLPAPLLKALFERCQVIARTPVKQGVRLVRAVEDLFPDQLDILEPIADMVLVPAYRSDSATRDALTQELASVAQDYDAARPEQQVALSMLAAQEILGALTFSLTAEKPEDTRLWVTDKGSLTLGATYTDNALTISAVLPEGGQLNIKSDEVEQQAKRSQLGSLNVVLTEPTVGKTYILEVLLASESVPLSFVIHLSQELT